MSKPSTFRSGGAEACPFLILCRGQDVAHREQDGEKLPVLYLEFVAPEDACQRQSAVAGTLRRAGVAHEKFQDDACWKEPAASGFQDRNLAERRNGEIVVGRRDVPISISWQSRSSSLRSTRTMRAKGDPSV
jgi:hypothetical protein